MFNKSFLNSSVFLADKNPFSGIEFSLPDQNLCFSNDALYFQGSCIGSDTMRHETSFLPVTPDFVGRYHPVVFSNHTIQYPAENPQFASAELRLMAPGDSVGDRPFSEYSRMFLEGAEWLGSFEPRGYQQEAVDTVLNHIGGQDKRALTVLPTGVGKTLIMAQTVRSLLLEDKSYSKALVLSHRNHIVRQDARYLRLAMGEEYVEILSGRDSDFSKPVLCSTVQSLLTMDNVPWDEIDVIVLDEAHHFVDTNTWFDPLIKAGLFRREDNKLIRCDVDKVLLGYTATPDRLDGSSLYSVFGDNLVYTRDINYFIDNHYLLPVDRHNIVLQKYLNPERSLFGREVWDLMNEEEQLNFFMDLMYDFLWDHDDVAKKSVVFLENRAEVLRLEELINEYTDFSAVSILADTENRPEKLAAFERGEIDIILNISVLDEGFDVEGIEAIVLLFDTESRRRVVQAVGRGMRNHNDLESMLLLDCTGQLDRHNIHTSSDVSYLYAPLKSKSQAFYVPNSNEIEDISKKHEPLGEWRWQGKGLRWPKNLNLFSKTLEEIFGNEDLVRVSYRSDLSEDDLRNWMSGHSLPSSLKPIRALSGQLSPLNLDRLIFAYKESVGGAIRHHLLGELTELVYLLDGEKPAQRHLISYGLKLSWFERHFERGLQGALIAIGFEDQSMSMADLLRERTYKVGLDDIRDNSELRDLFFKALDESGEEEMWIATAGTNGVNPSGNFSKGLIVLTHDQFVKWHGAEEFVYPKFLVRKSSDGHWELKFDPKVGGTKTKNTIIPAFVAAGWVRDPESFYEDVKRLKQETNITLEELIGDRELKQLFYRALDELNVDEVWITAGSGGLNPKGQIVQGLNLMSHEKFNDWFLRKRRKLYPRILIERTLSGTWRFKEHECVGGRQARSYYIPSLVEGEWVEDFEKVIIDAPQPTFADLTCVTPMELRGNDDLRTLFLSELEEIGQSQVWITAGAQGFDRRGRIAGGFILRSQAEFEEWSGRDKHGFPKILIEKRDDGCWHLKEGWDDKYSLSARGSGARFRIAPLLIEAGWVKT